MNIIGLLITMVSGAVGGSFAGEAMPERSLGPIGNSLTGLLGGGAGAAIMHLLGVTQSAPGGLDVATIVGSVAGGGIAGSLLMAIVGAISHAINQKA